MSIVVEERDTSPLIEDGPNGWIETLWTISGTDDPLAARDALKAEAPTSYASLPRLSVRVEAVGVDLWDGTARYQLDPSGGIVPPATNEVRITGRTTGGRKHVTHSTGTVDNYAHAGVEPPDFDGAINVDDEGHVEGVEIDEPVDEFTLYWYVPDGSFAAARSAAYALTGKANNATYRGYAAGELKFLGIDYTYRHAQDDWEVAYHFAARPNVTGVTIGDITPFDVGAWDYVWIRHADAVQNPFSSDVVLGKIADSAHVHRDLVKKGDFSTLGIP